MQPTKTIDYYHYWVCPFCKPVGFLLDVEGIKHNKHHIDLSKKQQKSPEYLKINPLGKVPAIIDDGFIVYESNTLMRYICNTYKVSDHWYPKDSKKRSLIDLYFEFHRANMFHLISFMFVHNGFNPNKTKADKIPRLDQMLKEIEQYFLKDKKFLASNDKVTIADVALIFQIVQLPWTNYDMTKFPKLTQWMADVFADDPRLKKHCNQFIEDYNTARQRRIAPKF